MAELTSGYVQDNEVVKASDINFGFDSQIDNIAKAFQVLLESKQDFVIGGRVRPYRTGGMNVAIEPIFGVNVASGECVCQTEITEPVSIPIADSKPRIDIIQVKSEFEEYDEQQRAFNDLETDVKTYKNVFTKKKKKLIVNVKKGTPGSVVAPNVDNGFIKLAEIVVSSDTTDITGNEIKNITSDISGLENKDWTNEKSITYNVGYISDVNERFRKEHNEDGTHKNNIIGTDELNIGTNSKQISGAVLPTGTEVNINGETETTSLSIADNIVLLANKITDIYNDYLKIGKFNFNGEVSVSDLIDENSLLVKPLRIGAAGDGTAYLKVDNKVIFTVTTEGTIRMANGYKATNNLDLVTKAVTDEINTRLVNLRNEFDEFLKTSDNTVYSNNVLSRFNSTIKVELATKINSNLQGIQQLDGVPGASGYKVLVRAQDNPKENGIYTMTAGAWARTAEYSTAEKLRHRYYLVTNGKEFKNRMFYCPLENFIIGKNDVVFSEFDKMETQQIEDGAVTREKLDNTTVDNIVKAILLKAHPVGSYYWSSQSTNPGTLFGGTWVQIKDRMIMAKGTTFTSNGGNTNGTITLNVNQLPSHSHGIDFTSGASSKSSTGGNGGHSHTRGTMNITGWWPDIIKGSWKTLDGGGAFYKGWPKEYTSNGHEAYSQSRNPCLTFDASRSWTGSTSPVDDHTHDMTHTHSIKGNTKNTGSNSGINIMPPYIVAYCWQRTA